MNENMNTGEVQEINIFEMMDGALGERVSYELGKVMRNCKDLNTEAKKTRTLTVEFALMPNETRNTIAVRASVKSKLAPVKALDGALMLGGTDTEPMLMEYKPQIPGQQAMKNFAADEPKLVKLSVAGTV